MIVMRIISNASGQEDIKLTENLSISDIGNWVGKFCSKLLKVRHSKTYIDLFGCIFIAQISAQLSAAATQ